MIRPMTLWTQWTSRRLTSDGLVPIMPFMQQPLLTSDEVAENLKVSCSHAYFLMKRGDFPVVHVGSLMRVKRHEHVFQIGRMASPVSQIVRKLFGKPFALNRNLKFGANHVMD